MSQVPSLYPKDYIPGNFGALSSPESTNEKQEYEQAMGQLEEKFQNYKKEIQMMEASVDEVKKTLLPIARVKKIMKSDEDISMISQEAPFIFSKACELFIMEITHRAWFHTKHVHKRCTLQRCDLASCLMKTDTFDFLFDVIPKEDLSEKMLQEKKNFMNTQVSQSYPMLQSPSYYSHAQSTHMISPMMNTGSSIIGMQFPMHDDKKSGKKSKNRLEYS